MLKFLRELSSLGPFFLAVALLGALGNMITRRTMGSLPELTRKTHELPVIGPFLKGFDDMISSDWYYKFFCVYPMIAVLVLGAVLTALQLILRLAGYF